MRVADLDDGEGGHASSWAAAPLRGREAPRLARERSAAGRVVRRTARPGTPKEKDVLQLDDDIRGCIAACTRCHQTCLPEAMRHCLDADGQHVPPAHQRLMVACPGMYQRRA